MTRRRFSMPYEAPRPAAELPAGPYTLRGQSDIGIEYGGTPTPDLETLLSAYAAIIDRPSTVECMITAADGTVIKRYSTRPDVPTIYTGTEPVSEDTSRRLDDVGFLRSPIADLCDKLVGARYLQHVEAERRGQLLQQSRLPAVADRLDPNEWFRR